MLGMANKIVDRVIMCLTNNENYIDFWNYISRVYSEKLNTKTTLMFSGMEKDLRELKESGRLSDRYGDIVFLPKVNGIHYDPNLDWTCTWGLFYGASLYPNDVCMLSGIDQIPLGGSFYELVNKINAREKYIIGFSDAYGYGYAGYENADFPSSHHVGLGKFFKSIYSIEDKWEEELLKVYSHNEAKAKIQTPSLWGLDETYSSYILRQHINNKNSPVPLVLITGFLEYWRSRRIDRGNGAIPVTDEVLKAIRDSRFTEYHSVRPFSANPDMEIIFNSIPKVANISSY